MAASIGDMLIQLGVQKDNKSFKSAEKSVKNLAQTAKKLLATVGIGFSLRKIWQIIMR